MRACACVCMMRACTCVCVCGVCGGGGRFSAVDIIRKLLLHLWPVIINGFVIC